MMELERQKPPAHRMKSTKLICGVVGETLLYNLTNNAIFAVDLDSSTLPWKRLNLYFEEIYGPGGSGTTYSPLHAGRRDIYFLMIRTFWLCRQDQSCPYIQSHVQKCLAQRDMIENDIIPLLDATNYPSDQLERYKSRQSIQALSLHVLLLKLAHPKKCSHEPALQTAVRAALEAVQKQATTRTLLMSDGLAWPLCVLLCATPTKSLFEEVVTLTDDYVTIMAPGIKWRMTKALRQIWAMRAASWDEPCTLESQGSCMGKHDTTGLLLRKEGIFCEPD